MRRTFLLILLGLVTQALDAQPLELLTRFDYYFSEDTTATLILIGEGAEATTSLSVDGTPARRLKPYQDVAQFRIDISRYTTGDRVLPATAAVANGGSVDLELHLTTLSPKHGAVRVDRLTRGLYVDDLPFFPFGFYAGYPVGDLPVQEIYNAMNMVGVYQSNEEETLAGRKAYMDLCASLGMKVNYAVNGLVGTPHNQSGVVISPDEEEHRWNLLRREVEIFKDHPALLSWYMNDEPVGQSRSPELLEKAYRIIKEIDPYHPVSVVFVIPGRAAPFANALDIAMTDPYPIPGDVMAVREHMQALSDAFRFRKALWLVPQAFGGGEFWQREPTGPEIRAMTWLGIQEGARGIQYFIRRHPNLFPKSRLAWNEAVRAAHEVSMIQPWLFSDEPSVDLATGNDRIRAVALSHEKSTLILVTNVDNHPASFEIDVSGLATTDSLLAQLPFENRSIMVGRGRLSETMGPLDTRAYLLEEARETKTDPHNLFPNPGFEWVPSPGVPAGSYADSDHRPAYDGSTYFIDSRISHAGRNALRFHSVSDTSHLQLTFQRMYVQKGRTYHSSLWSRHAKYGGPVAFTVKIPQQDVIQNFVTSRTWTRHDLRFKATRETPFVQLALNTTDAGTFWIDDVVVVPDPIIDVAVEDGPRATVSLRSGDPDATISYRLNGSAPIPYTVPFGVRTFSEIDLQVSRPAWPDETISLTIPLSLATRKSCTFQSQYSPKYQGTGSGTIVDGEYGSLAFRDGKYLGFDAKDVEFTIDLVDSADVGSVMVHFLVSPDDGIHAPTAVEAWTSADGRTWRRLGRIDNAESTRHGNPYHLSLTADGELRRARFVRVKVTSPKVIPEGYLFSGTDAWIFIDETLVHSADD